MKIQRPGPDAPGGPRVPATCVVCDYVFWPRKVDVDNGHGKYCRNTCSSKAQRRPCSLRCVVCGKKFTSFSADAKLCCNAKCAERYYDQRYNRVRKCKNCGCEYRKKQKRSARFCGSKCSLESTKAKMRIAGKEFFVADVADAVGIDHASMRQRLQEVRKAGSPDEKALKTNRKGRSPGSPRFRMLTAHGKTQCITDWAKELGISATAIARRIRCGRSEAEALVPRGS
jgi:hypothetical protein